MTNWAIQQKSWDYDMVVTRQATAYITEQIRSWYFFE
jgi:hypothetical protein